MPAVKITILGYLFVRGGGKFEADERAFYCGLREWSLLFVGARASVVINEFMAGSSDRRLSWSTNDVARIGSGLVWSQPEFADGT